MGQYDRAIATAIRLIKKKGRAVIWVKQDEIVSDGNKPWLTTEPSNPQTFPVVMVFIKPKQDIRNALFHLIEGTSIPTGAPMGLLYGNLPFTPAITDSVLDGGATLVVKDMDVIQPGVDAVLYRIQFR